MVKVSIVIPFFNHGKYINETIGSIISQSFKDYEVIIVDDGSTDTNSLLTLREFDDLRIKVIHTPNRGVCAARNTGCELASGDYLLFLDADDKISSEYLMEATKVLDCYPDIKAVSSRVELFGIRKGEYRLPEFSLDKLLARNILVISCLIRAKDFRDTAGFNPNMKDGFEDWDFWISLLGKGGKVKKLEIVGFYYRIQKISRNHTIDATRLKMLRKQIYLNHINLYSATFIDPIETFEFQEIRNSIEYKIGKIICIPLRKGLQILRSFR